MEETISAILSSPKEAIGRLQLIHRLAERKRIIKPHTNFVEDFRAYAAGEKVCSPFISPPLIAKRVLTTPDLFDLRQIATETKAKIQDEYDTLTEIYRAKILPLAESARKEGIPTFDEFWDTMAIGFVEEWAKQAGVLEKCRERGSQGLLEIRSIRIATLGQVSDLYAISYEGRTPKRSDSRDMQHVLLSSATDALITNDKNLRRLMQRMSIDGYEILSLGELLERLPG